MIPPVSALPRFVRCGTWILPLITLGILSLWARSIWRDDAVTANLTWANFTLGSSNGLFFIGVSTAAHLETALFHHSAPHRPRLWWRPQVRTDPRAKGGVVMIPYWLILTCLAVFGLRSWLLPPASQRPPGQLARKPSK